MRLMIKFLIFFLITIGFESANASETFGFCFKSDTNIKKVEGHLKQILLDFEQVKTISRQGLNCLEMNTGYTPKEVAKRFIEKKFKLESTYKSNALPEQTVSKEVIEKACHILFYTPGEKKKDHWFYLKENKFTSVSFNNSSIFLSCRYKLDEIEMTFKFDDSKTETYSLNKEKKIYLKEVIKNLTGKEMNSLEGFTFSLGK
jgi:hypothetical protein